MVDGKFVKNQCLMIFFGEIIVAISFMGVVLIFELAQTHQKNINMGFNVSNHVVTCASSLFHNVCLKQ